MRLSFGLPGLISKGGYREQGAQGCGWHWPESVPSPPTSLCCPSGMCGKRGGSRAGAPRRDLLSQPGVSCVNETWVGGSHLLLAAATHTPSVGFPSYQLHLDGRFQGHHGLGWGFREPSDLWHGETKGLGSAHALEALCCLWPCPGSQWPWPRAVFLCRRQDATPQGHSPGHHKDPELQTGKRFQAHAGTPVSAPSGLPFKLPPGGQEGEGQDPASLSGVTCPWRCVYQALLFPAEKPGSLPWALWSPHLP